jgi:hypothetical protein
VLERLLGRTSFVFCLALYSGEKGYLYKHAVHPSTLKPSAPLNVIYEQLAYIIQQR